MKGPGNGFRPPRGMATSQTRTELMTMTDPIGRFAAWVSRLLTPRGAHRRTSPPVLLAPSTPPPPRTPLPAHRSPYGLDDSAPLDGTAARSVRPYVTAREQRLRRRELVMAGPYWIHGMEVA